jgi:hypothetical protein
MSKVSYVTSFRKLSISEQISGYVELIPGVNITNDVAVKARILTPQLTRAAGAIEAQFLNDAPNLVFGEFDSEFMQNLTSDKFLLVILIWIDLLLRNGWLIKDHAMECDAAFLKVERALGTDWTRNFLAMRPSFADGNIDKDIAMSITELTNWGKTNISVESYLSEARSSVLYFMMEKSYARSGRAMQFVNTARRTPDLAFKIANYCSALETLFTTESTELAHKLSERVAFFLGQRGYNRRTVFSAVKGAYGVRSKLVHGDTLKSNQIADLPSLSQLCDIYLRTILKEIFDCEETRKIFDSHSQSIEDYFAHLIFGPPEKIDKSAP